jgi:hypothetical protein
MAFLSALPSGGVCAVFTDAQLAKISEAMSNTVVTWFFMAFLNAKFRGRSQSFGAARTDSDSTVATRAQQLPMQTDQRKNRMGFRLCVEPI